MSINELPFFQVWTVKGVLLKTFSENWVFKTPLIRTQFVEFTQAVQSVNFRELRIQIGKLETLWKPIARSSTEFDFNSSSVIQKLDSRSCFESNSLTQNLRDSMTSLNEVRLQPVWELEFLSRFLSGNYEIARLKEDQNCLRSKFHWKRANLSIVIDDNLSSV